jgi:hypothetical protein
VTQQEELYIHFVSCTDTLNDAWRILHEIKQSRSHPLVGAAFQFALIQYSKPYLTSFGIAGRHKLDNRHVPSTHRDLHNRLIEIEAGLVPKRCLTKPCS